MQRSATLVAASFWLLLLSACGDSPPAKSALDPARQPKAARGARVSVGHGGTPQKSHETPEEAARHPHAATAAAGPVSQEELAQRFGNARALSVLAGSASYYSDKLAGRSTASGMPYEPNGYTAAHRTLPFGSVLRVTRREGGQVVYVRVTDRGPYGPRGRILDLSRAAAEQLGMLRAGVVDVRVEVLEYGPRKSRKSKKRRR
jgi:rare lipoprotein A